MIQSQPSNQFMMQCIVHIPHIQNVLLHKKEKPREKSPWAFLPFKSRQRPTFPQPHGCSIIGPGGLNFRVRDGNGWNPSGKVTEKIVVRIYRQLKTSIIKIAIFSHNCLDHVYQEQMLLSRTAD